MKQILFVLRRNQIASWVLQRGRLTRRALNGNDWSDFTASYWDEWKDANQISEGVDAILLSDEPNGFGFLPDWLQAVTEASAWNLDTLAKLTADGDFAESGIVLVQGKNEKPLGESEAGTSVKYTLLSSLVFKLPKESAKPVAPAPEPKPEQKKPASILCADSYGDKKALALKVGDTVSAIITVIAPMRGSYYAKSDALDDLIKIKMSALPKGMSFDQGADVFFKVVAVDDLRVSYAIA